MNKDILLVKVNKNKYYNYKIIKNNKYNRYIKRSKIRIVKNLDFRNEIKLGGILAFNNYVYKDKFVKYLN